MRELTTNEMKDISGGVSPEMVLLVPVSAFGFTLGVAALAGASLQTAAIIMTASVSFFSMLVCC